MNYILHILIILNIYIILTSSSNLLIGMTNLLSMGQAALYGIGAYISAFLVMKLGLNLFLTIPLVMLITGIATLIVSIPAMKLKEDYFILASLGFQMIVYTILYNWVDVTRGPFGIVGIPSPKLFGSLQINGIFPFFIFSSLLSVGIVYLIYKLIHSPFGIVLKGIRDDEQSVQVLGKKIRIFKTQIFFISGAFIGVAGFLYATYVSYIDPSSFNLDEAIFIITAVLIGGSGSRIRGPILGALFVVLLPEVLRFLGIPDSIAANMRQIIYGLTIIVLMFKTPWGIAGEKRAF